MDLSGWTVPKLKKRLLKAAKSTKGNKVTLTQRLHDYFADSEYNEWTLEELRSVLRARGEPTQGRKTDLVQRVRAAGGLEAVLEEAEEELEEMVPVVASQRVPASLRIYMRQLVGKRITPALAKQLEQERQAAEVIAGGAAGGEGLAAYEADILVRRAPFVVEVGTTSVVGGAPHTEIRVQRSLYDVDALADFLQLMTELFWPTQQANSVFGELYEEGRFDNRGRGVWFINLVPAE